MQGKTGWWIAGACAVVILLSVGYGMGKRAGAHAAATSRTLEPAGAPLNSTIQIEPIQPQDELAAISTSQNNSSKKQQGATAAVPTTTTTAASQNEAPAAVASAPAAATAAATAATAESATENSARIRQVQQALKVAGFDPGPADGRMGARTRAAIRDFQLANGLEPDGKVGPRTWNKLETVAKNSASPSTSTQ